MPRQPAGLRERKKEKTRQALASAAMRLFAERGYEATTVADIAAAAEVSTRTFFAYFPSKEDVFFTGTRERLDLLRQAFAAHSAALPPLTAMRATLDQIIETTYRIATPGSASCASAPSCAPAVPSCCSPRTRCWPTASARAYPAWTGTVRSPPPGRPSEPWSRSCCTPWSTAGASTRCGRP